jgi:hypothetical protein
VFGVISPETSVPARLRHRIDPLYRVGAHLHDIFLSYASDPLVLSWAAHALGNCGFWQDAQRYAQRAVDLNPNIAAGRLVLALVCVRFKRCDDVMRHVDALESLAPRGSITHLGIGFRGLAHYRGGPL